MTKQARYILAYFRLLGQMIAIFGGIFIVGLLCLLFVFILVGTYKMIPW